MLKTEPQFTVYALYKKLQSELNAVQGTSIKGVTKDELLAKEIMIPCYEEQEKIGSYLHSLDNLITLHQREDLIIVYGAMPTNNPKYLILGNSVSWVNYLTR